MRSARHSLGEEPKRCLNARAKASPRAEADTERDVEHTELRLRREPQRADLLAVELGRHEGRADLLAQRLGLGLQRLQVGHLLGEDVLDALSLGLCRRDRVHRVLHPLDRLGGRSRLRSQETQGP